MHVVHAMYFEPTCTNMCTFRFTFEVSASHKSDLNNPGLKLGSFLPLSAVPKSAKRVLITITLKLIVAHT